jgi:hypothetical protein
MGLPPKDSLHTWTPWSVFQDGSYKSITPTTKARGKNTSRVAMLKRSTQKRNSIVTRQATILPKTRCKPQSRPKYFVKDYNTIAETMATFPPLSSFEQNCRWLVSVMSAQVPKNPLIKTAPVYFYTVPFQQFHVLFNPLFKVLFIFPSRYLFAIGLVPIFSFRRDLPPILGCIPKQPDSSFPEQRLD